MSSKKFLSNKKTAQQTISISPALKDWLKRYVNVKHRENLDDERYKSISSFYNYILENVLNLFKKGKTLDDFKRVEDKQIGEFFDKFTFRATIPLYEMVIETNRFTPFSFDFSTRFLLLYLRLLRGSSKSQSYEQSYEDMLIFFERIRSRYGTTNISKDMKMELILDKKGGYATGNYEFIGKYKNLHFENIKFIAAILGVFGIRVVDFIYSPDNYYCRLDLLATGLLFRKELVKKERLKLLEENVDFIINYNRMLDDKDMYLWMRLAEDNGALITFKNQDIFNKWVKSIENDLRKYGKKEDFLFKMLQFFDKLHWIRFENVKDLSFQIEQSIENNIKHKQYLLEYLSRHSEPIEVDGIYYLK